MTASRRAAGFLCAVAALLSSCASNGGLVQTVPAAGSSESPTAPNHVVLISPTSCRASDLTVTDVEQDGASGRIATFVTVRNDGPSTCTMPRSARLSAGAAQGRVPVPTHWGSYFDPTRSLRATIGPHDAALIAFDSVTRCDEPPQAERTWQTVALVLVDGELPLLGVEVRGCGSLGVGRWRLASS